MPSIALNDFKEAMNDMCRPNRFKVMFSEVPSGVDFFAEDDFYFVKACSIPGKTIGEVDLNWCGYKYKIAGDPTFADVTVTFLNHIEEDGSSKLRDQFEQWLNVISNDGSNVRAVADDYKCKVIIEQLDGEGDTVQSYSLWNAHPKDLSEIALSMDTTDAVEEFNVVFSYSYYTTGEDQESGGNTTAAEQTRATPKANFTPQLSPARF
jgi:hypothetical protein